MIDISYLLNVVRSNEQIESDNFHRVLLLCLLIVF